MSKRIVKKTVEKVNLHAENVEKTKESKCSRTSKYETKVKPYLSEIERYHRCGVTEAQLCAYYNISKTQWIQYKHNNPELSELLYNAKKVLKIELTNKAYEVAVGGTYIETTVVEYYDLDKDGRKVITGGKTTTHTRYNKPDVGMLQFLLINRFPDEFVRDPQTIELRKKALELAEKKGTPLPDNWGEV